jgi:signal transduction histidine kinase
MLKIVIYIFLVFFVVNLSAPLYAQSDFQLDTAVANSYKCKIVDYYSVNKDSLNHYLYLIDKFKNNTNNDLAKAICNVSEGYVFFKNHNYDSALVFFKEGEYHVKNQMDTNLYIKLLNLISVCNLYSGEADTAIAYLKKANILVSQKNDDLLLAKNYYDLSNAYSQKDDYVAALKCVSFADSIYKANNITDYDAYIYNSMAILYSKTNAIANSKRMYYKSIDVSKEIGDNNLLASIYLNIGDLYSRNDVNFDSASYYLENCIKIAKQYNINYLIPMAQINLSGLYFEQKRHADCVVILRDNLGSEKPQVKSSAWINTGIAYFSLNNLDSALYYLNEGVKFAKNSGDKENLYYAYKALVSIDSAKGDFESQLNHYKIFKALEDSFNRGELELELAKNKEHLEVLHQKKIRDYWENEALILKRLSQQKTFKNYMLLALLLLAAIIIVVINNLRSKNKRYHQELKLLNDRITKKKQLLEDNNFELNKLIKTKNTLFSIISHDLRSPIGTNVQLLNLLVEDLESYSKEELKEIFISLKDSASNIYELLNSLLEWSRIEQGRLEPSFETINLKNAIESYMPQVESLCSQKQIKLTMSIDESINLKSDHNFLSTIIRNLISNAVKFSNRNSEIIIEGKYIDNDLLLCVIDHGVGMKPEITKTIFNIDSVDTILGTEKEKGAGFGLKLVKSMVDKINAEIFVESKLGEGSKFCLKFNSECIIK